MKWFENAILLILLGFVVMQIGPRWWTSSQRVGQVLSSIEVNTLDGDEMTLEFLEPQVLIFWATWCSPCHLEMRRYQNAINDGEIPAHHVRAISMGESHQSVQNFLKQKSYSFPVYVDPHSQLGRDLEIEMTPTVLHVKKGGEVAWASTGVSATGIYRAIRLFQ